MKNSTFKRILIGTSVFASMTLLLCSCDQSSDELRDLRNNWSTYIYATSTQYQFSKLGGISEFEIPVRNNTDYLVEELKIRVQYIKAAGGLYKSEYVVLSNLMPHTTKVVKAPKSRRGTSVDFEIVEAYSRGMKFCFPQGGGDYSDPYYCK